MISSSRTQEVVVVFADDLRSKLGALALDATTTCQATDTKMISQRSALGCITNKVSAVAKTHTDRITKQVCITGDVHQNDENRNHCHRVSSASSKFHQVPVLPADDNSASNVPHLCKDHEQKMCQKNARNTKPVLRPANNSGSQVDVPLVGNEATLSAEQLQQKTCTRAPTTAVAVVLQSQKQPQGHATGNDSFDEEEHERLCKERLEDVFGNVDYAQDTYSYLRQSELAIRPKPHYMRKQAEITHNMRTILVDWLVDVAAEYRLQRETLFLCVNYLDRFLSAMMVLKTKLQLVGATALFLASKFEETTTPRIDEFIYVTADAYTKPQMLRMEQLILRVLSFKMSAPTANTFCEFMLKQMNADSQTSSLSMYLLELTLLDGDTFLKHLPSVTAAAAVCLANITLANAAWPSTLVSATGYQPSDLKHCLQDLHAVFLRPPTKTQKAVRRKYSTNKYHCVSSLTAPPCLPTVFL